MRYSSQSDAVRGRALKKVSQRLVPYLILLYLIAYVDRVNVGLAALTMNKDLGISPFVYGTGSGIFFLAYFLFELPSNLLLERFGARRWIARIMVTWGIISMATALARGPVSFVILRFLLGLSEAGLFPGVIFYLTYWFLQQERAKAMALFYLGSPLARSLPDPSQASSWIR